MSESSCFIIMPLTTPAQYVDTYKGDKDHFIHVLDELFVPAIEAADMTPIRPIVEGSEVIHGEIIRHLTKADLVLCDMTIFNPNVFFELGIRTALDKPISMVKDNFTDKTPFDLAPVNYHQYDSSLTSWVIETQIMRLKDHLKASMNSGVDNPIWKYFGISGHAEVPREVSGVEEQLTYLIGQVEMIKKQGKQLKNYNVKQAVAHVITALIDLRELLGDGMSDVLNTDYESLKGSILRLCVDAELPELYEEYETMLKRYS